MAGIAAISNAHVDCLALLFSPHPLFSKVYIQGILEYIFWYFFSIVVSCIGENKNTCSNQDLIVFPESINKC